MFIGPKGATPRRSNFSRYWREAARVAGIDPELGLHFHDLRHTGNELTVEGSNLRHQMARMGHDSVRAALIYQRANKERERRTVERLSSAIAAARSTSETEGHLEGTDEDPRADNPTQRPPGDPS